MVASSAGWPDRRASGRSAGPSGGPPAPRSCPRTSAWEASRVPQRAPGPGPPAPGLDVGHGDILGTRLGPDQLALRGVLDDLKVGKPLAPDGLLVGFPPCVRHPQIQ